jgi:GNAT superfamily N-acetyltransferase
MPGRVRLEVVTGECQWRHKRDLHAADAVCPDGHAHDPGDWIEMERRRADTGMVQWYLVHCGDRVCGTLGLLHLGELTRLKNVLIHPEWRGKGLAGEAIAWVLANRLGGKGRAVGVFAIGGTPGERLYRSCGMQPRYSQLEWVRSL